MKNRVRLIWLGMTLAGLGVARGDLAQELSAVSSELRQLRHGYATAAAWSRSLDRLDAVIAAAESLRRPDLELEAVLLKARALADVRNDPAAGIAALRSARRKLAAGAAPDGMPRLFVLEAELLGRQGETDAVRTLMDEFRASPWYDPAVYPYEGGQGRNVPLAIVRPNPRGSDSITLTAMRNQLDQARLEGSFLPSGLSFATLDGRTWRADDFRGNYVLLDFFLAGYPIWQRELPLLRRRHNDFGRRGLLLIGLCLDQDAAGLAAVAARLGGLPWPLAEKGPALRAAAQLHVFGESLRLLIDPTGRIIARNPAPADLDAMLRRAFE